MKLLQKIVAVNERVVSRLEGGGERYKLSGLGYIISDLDKDPEVLCHTWIDDCLYDRLSYRVSLG